jgi:alkylation response protein AidB-like acyl-CoA dehydrogenase
VRHDRHDLRAHERLPPARHRERHLLPTRRHHRRRVRPARPRHAYRRRLPRDRPLAVLQRLSARRLAHGQRLVDTGDPTKPELRSLLVRRDQVEIHDTWDTAGLRGTGSHDFSVRDLDIPHAHSLSLFAAPTIDAPLYRQPFFGTLAAGVAAVALGIARNALDSLLELAAHKPSSARKTIAHRELVQLHVARGEAELQAARAGLFTAVERAADEVTTQGHASLRTRALLRAAACHAATASARAVDLAYEAGGASSIYSSSPLQRCFRDVHVATQHIMVAPTSAILAGRVLLGLDSDTTTL